MPAEVKLKEDLRDAHIENKVLKEKLSILYELHKISSNINSLGKGLYETEIHLYKSLIVPVAVMALGAGLIIGLMF